MADLPDIAEALVVRPGDTLILRYGTKNPFSLAEVEGMQAEVSRLLPGVETLFVVADDMRVYRPDADEIVR